MKMEAETEKGYFQDLLEELQQEKETKLSLIKIIKEREIISLCLYNLLESLERYNQVAKAARKSSRTARTIRISMT